MSYANCWANSRSEVSRIEVTNSSSVSTKMNNTIIHLFHEIWLNLGTCQHMISSMFFPMNVDTWPYRKCKTFFYDLLSKSFIFSVLVSLNAILQLQWFLLRPLGTLKSYDLYKTGWNARHGVCWMTPREKKTTIIQYGVFGNIGFNRLQAFTSCITQKHVYKFSGFSSCPQFFNNRKV